jgi:hypothetical protein
MYVENFAGFRDFNMEQPGLDSFPAHKSDRILRRE